MGAYIIIAFIIVQMRNKSHYQHRQTSRSGNCFEILSPTFLKGMRREEGRRSVMSYKVVDFLPLFIQHVTRNTLLYLQENLAVN